MLKICGSQLCGMPHHLFSFSLRLQNVPQFWKISCIVPMPTALTFMKTFEKLGLKQLRKLVTVHQDPLQFATQNPLTPRQTWSYISWIMDYLNNRPQFVRLQNCVSETALRRIILNNPKKRNALSLAMLTSLQENILTGIDDKDLRVIIISAQGPVFSSGHDLKELTSTHGRDYHTRVFRVCSEVMTLIQDLPVPVIAMVNGIATAAGCQLVASCDIAVATDKSSFATPGVNVGLFCSTPGVAIGRAVPRKVAMEMLFTGRPISAQEALVHGLVSKVVLEECLEEETLAIARRICESSRPVVALGKAAFQKQMAQGRDAAYATAAAVMVDNLALRDGQEGIRAFLEKRRPLWANTTEKAHD